MGGISLNFRCWYSILVYFTCMCLKQLGYKKCKFCIHVVQYIRSVIFLHWPTKARCPFNHFPWLLPNGSYSPPSLGEIAIFYWFRKQRNCTVSVNSSHTFFNRHGTTSFKPHWLTTHPHVYGNGRAHRKSMCELFNRHCRLIRHSICSMQKCCLLPIYLRRFGLLYAFGIITHRTWNCNFTSLKLNQNSESKT